MEAAIFRPTILSISRHKIEFKLNQIKDHLMNTVEATCRGDPGAVYLTSTVRQASFATQGKNFITKASILESLHTFENEKRHIHRVFWTDRSVHFVTLFMVRLGHRDFLDINVPQYFLKL